MSTPNLETLIAKYAFCAAEEQTLRDFAQELLGGPAVKDCRDCSTHKGRHSYNGFCSEVD